MFQKTVIQALGILFVCGRLSIDDELNSGKPSMASSEDVIYEVEN